MSLDESVADLTYVIFTNQKRKSIIFMFLCTAHTRSHLFLQGSHEPRIVKFYSHEICSTLCSQLLFSIYQSVMQGVQQFLHRIQSVLFSISLSNVQFLPHFLTVCPPHIRVSSEFNLLLKGKRHPITGYEGPPWGWGVQV